MALSYYLELSADMKPVQALEKISGQLPGLTWSEDGYQLSDPTITIHSTEPVAPASIREAFRFTPTLTVGFRFVSNTDYERFRETLLQATMLLLNQSQDAVLLFNGEIIVLQWLGGRLTINSDYHIWDEDWLRSRLTLPFEHRPLPSPLL